MEERVNTKHILKSTKKELHGWYPGKRECTAERLLINPYNGCEVGCFFCYALSLPGNFQTFRQTGIITVAKDFHKVVAEQLDSIDIASCGYLSAVTEPFQDLNERYRLSEKVIKVFIERNIPVEFITKSRIPQEVIDLIKGHPHCFGQVSILTPHEALRRILSPRGANTFELFNNLRRLAKEKIYAVCRIDPILPYITDKRKDLTELIERAISSGARHIVASILDIPLRISQGILMKIRKYFGKRVEYDYRRLYGERIGYLNARINYRKAIFELLGQLCAKRGITFALCMEYELKDGRPCGLNKQFMSSRNCEGIDIPIYKRKGNKFYPAANCNGACLVCQEAKCGIEDLAMAKGNSKKAWKLSDYRRWSKDLNQKQPKFIQNCCGREEFMLS